MCSKGNGKKWLAGDTRRKQGLKTVLLSSASQEYKNDSLTKLDVEEVRLGIDISVWLRILWNVYE